MKKWFKPALIILIILAVVILVLLGLFVKQKLDQAREEKIQREYELLSQQDREAAERLLQRLDNLKNVKEELILPQVELIIRL